MLKSIVYNKLNFIEKMDSDGATDKWNCFYPDIHKSRDSLKWHFYKRWILNDMPACHVRCLINTCVRCLINTCVRCLINTCVRCHISKGPLVNPQWKSMGLDKMVEHCGRTWTIWISKKLGFLKMEILENVGCGTLIQHNHKTSKW
jgi:hypothetical protein